jgi:hypothetical protein
MPRYKLRTLLILLAIGPPMLAYVGSYAVLSRRGYAFADSVGSPGFWFVPPNTQRDVKKNNEYITLYWPLVRLEQFFGSKRGLAHEPCGLEGSFELPP